MRYTVTTDPDNKLVRITHIGEMQLEDMLSARAEAGRRLKDNNLVRLLVDVTQLESAPSTMDAFEISTSHHNDLHAGIRLAILTSASLLPDARFAENVANNRGMNVLVFTDEAAALEWLLQE